MKDNEILDVAEKYLDKDEKNNGVCISIRTDEIENENTIRGLLLNCSYRFNSAAIDIDQYGIKRLVFFNGSR